MTLESFLSSSSMPESVSSFLKPFLSLLINDNLLELYLNPLYLFPILGALFCALFVYLFGFTSTIKNPPTLQVFTNEKKSHPTHKKDKRKEKKDGKFPKNQVNGHISMVEKHSKASNEETNKKANLSNLDESSTKNVNKDKKKSNATMAKKSKEVFISSEEDVNAGEWIEAVSKKRNRKQKEELQNRELNKSKEEEKKSETEETTLAKSSKDKKSKPKTDKKKEEISKQPEKVEESKPGKSDSSKDKANAEQSKQVNSPIVKPIEHETYDSLNIDEYTFAKEQRPSKKNKKQEKHNAKQSEQKNKKNSETIEKKVEPELAQEQPKSKDKITQSIVDNYDNKNNINSNKSKKQKKKSNSEKIVTDGEISNEVETAENKLEEKFVEKAVEPVANKNQLEAAINETSKPRKSENKVAANKKPRSRREQ